MSTVLGVYEAVALEAMGSSVGKLSLRSLQFLVLSTSDKTPLFSRWPADRRKLREQKALAGALVEGPQDKGGTACRKPQDLLSVLWGSAWSLMGERKRVSLCHYFPGEMSSEEVQGGRGMADGILQQLLPDVSPCPSPFKQRLHCRTSCQPQSPSP